MKKLTALICAVLLIMTLSGCSDVIANKPSIKEADNSMNSNLNTERETLKAVSEDTRIFYPKLQGYKGELLMDYMNQSIKQTAEFYAEQKSYTDVKIDYEVKRLDENIVSILFRGTGKLNGSREINILKSINLDVQSTNPITYENFIKNDKNSRDEVARILDKQAENKGITKGIESEGIFIYFEGENAVFFYMPPDDSTLNWVELSVPLKELDGLINTDFGERPAS